MTIPKRDRSVILWTNEKGEQVPVGRILGRKNWTDADWNEDARRNKLNTAAAAARRQALASQGWVLHDSYCSHDHCGHWAQDPLTGARVTHEEAYKMQEGRDPGSIPPWPKFDNDWTPPSSPSKLRLDTSEIKLQPLPMPSGLIFYLDYVYGADKPKK